MDDPPNQPRVADSMFVRSVLNQIGVQIQNLNVGPDESRVKELVADTIVEQLKRAFSDPGLAEQLGTIVNRKLDERFIGMRGIPGAGGSMASRLWRQTESEVASTLQAAVAAFQYTVSLQGPSGAVSFPLDGRLEIGRDASAEIVVRCGDVIKKTGILDQNVSRSHLLVYQDGGKVMVQDAGSTNGTFLDRKCLPGWRKRRPSDPVCVDCGCSIAIGATTLRILAREIATR
ncbi:MAG: FHA domain-containing protein [Chloroflexi bacterium]|nr:FHA domain-containing protein [Chloroflexota bacterium]